MGRLAVPSSRYSLVTTIVKLTDQVTFTTTLRGHSCDGFVPVAAAVRFVIGRMGAGVVVVWAIARAPSGIADTSYQAYSNRAGSPLLRFVGQAILPVSMGGKRIGADRDATRAAFSTFVKAGNVVQQAPTLG
jgi:hypothetical protein